MSLLAFMKYMTDHPDEMAAYKRDPNAFFDKHPDIALTEEAQRAVQGYPRLEEESTTVFRVARIPEQGPGANTNTAPSEDMCGEGTICLKGVKVIIHAIADNDVFFAEPEGGIARCVTLPHSYIQADGPHICFNLHLCYTDPNDELDKPQVLYIQTVLQAIGIKPNYVYKPITIHIKHPGYILVLPKRETHLHLAARSCYSPDTGELKLVFDYQSKDQ